MNANARIEFLTVTKPYKVIGAIIEINSSTYVLAKLDIFYTEDDLSKFLEKIDVEYDSGHGTKHLYGKIYCEDGIWMDRGEYDGSEWWNINSYPNLLETFEKSKVLKYERLKKLEQLKDVKG